MNKTRKSLTKKLILFAIFVTIIVGKLLFTAFLLFTAKNAIAATAVSENKTDETTKQAAPINKSSRTTASDELAKLLNNIRTMQATFEQYIINSNDVIIGEKTKGTMHLSRPGKFRWEAIKPNKQLIIINKNNHYIYDADLEQLVKRKVNYCDPLNPAILLTSPITTLKKYFTIVKLESSDQQETWFKLIPKTQENAQENSYQWIKIHFTKGKLDTMQIADNLGQKSVINFSNIIFNTSLSTKIFTFAPPPNTDIFETE